MDNRGLKYRPITEDEYDRYFSSMFEETGDYLEQSLEILGLTRAGFANVFRTLGEIYVIESEGKEVGFYWLEYRDRVCHIHALIIFKCEQRKGMGLAAINHIEQYVVDNIESIEVGIHESNIKAFGLCKKTGFEKVEIRSDIGFVFMRKKMSI